MCTLVILRRPGHRWPVLIGANRDEMIDRPSKPPGRHWPDRPEVLAGLDVLAGGSCPGINDWGVAAAVVDPEPGAAGEHVEPGDHFRPVGPMPAGRLRGPVDHLVAIGADQHRPAMPRTAEDHQGAHSPSGTALARLW